MERISVIVPVYKVEKDLERCVRSIQNQTYVDLEIILVDDGSPDRCGTICDELAAQDGRIKVIHKQNGGLSSARNAGIDAATGEYIAFVDSDDWIDPTMLSVLYNLCIKNNAEIAECSYRRLLSDCVREETLCTGKVSIVTPVEAIKCNLTWVNLKPVAWNKLYRRDVIGDIRYPVGRIHEDEFTTHKYYLAAKKIAYVDVSFYNYNCKRGDSITASFKVANLDKCDAFWEKVHLVWSSPELQELDMLMCSTYCFLLFDCLVKCVRNRIYGKRVNEVIRDAIDISTEICTRNIGEPYIKCFEVLKEHGIDALEKHYKEVFEGGEGNGANA